MIIIIIIEVKYIKSIMGNQIFESNLSVPFLFRLACTWLIEPMTTVSAGVGGWENP